MGLRDEDDVGGQGAVLGLRLGDDVLGRLDRGGPLSLEVHPQTPFSTAYAVA